MAIDKVGILGVQLGFGAGKTGSELGVNAMRLSKTRGSSLAEHIRHLGIAVRDHGDAVIARPPDDAAPANPKHLAEMVESSLNIIADIDAILPADELPVILGGEHAIATPTSSAIASH